MYTHCVCLKGRQIRMLIIHSSIHSVSLSFNKYGLTTCYVLCPILSTTGRLHGLENLSYLFSLEGITSLQLVKVLSE